MKMLNNIVKKCSLKTLIESDYITITSGRKNFLGSISLYLKIIENCSFFNKFDIN